MTFVADIIYSLARGGVHIRASDSCAVSFEATQNMHRPQGQGDYLLSHCGGGHHSNSIALHQRITREE